ncbi:MAG TPA: iron-containing alcohol dehydrogenase, partial [Kiloniellales bacterium]|nr:iron-containing alcohol dehydrogenase [Kiloniellales bacterium]
VLPAVLRFNAGHVGDKYVRLRLAMGLGEGADIAMAIEDLNRRLGLPANLREMGVDPALIPELAVAATRDHCAATNPRPADSADYEALFREALG